MAWCGPWRIGQLAYSTARYRAPRDHHEQRQLLDGLAQPVDDQQRAGVGPLQVVDEQRDLSLGTPPLQQRHHRLGDDELHPPQGRRSILFQVLGQQPRERRQVRVGRVPYAQAVGDRGERYPLLQLLAATRQHLDVLPAGRRTDLPEQRGLADPGVALQHHRPAAAPAHRRDQRLKLPRLVRPAVQQLDHP